MMDNKSYKPDKHLQSQHHISRDGINFNDSGKVKNYIILKIYYTCIRCLSSRYLVHITILSSVHTINSSHNSTDGK